MLPIPESIDELDKLPMRRKGDWEGAGWLMAALVLLARLAPVISAAACLGAYAGGLPRWTVYALGAVVLPSSFANKGADLFMRKFSTYWWGVLWYGTQANPRIIEKFVMEHEALHHWQSQNIGLFKLKYICPWPYWRRHMEAAAYGLDVAQGRRSLESAAASMRHPLYFMFLTRRRSIDLVNAYKALWSSKIERS